MLDCYGVSGQRLGAMAKFLLKCKKWLVYHGRTLCGALVVLAVLGGAAYYAISTNEEPEQVAEGDTTLSKIVQEVSKFSYDDALRLLAEGEKVKARVVMQRLAPVLNSSKEARGNPNAHLWLAKQLIDVQKTGFIESFPIDRVDGKALNPGFKLDTSEVVERSLRHLSAAIALDPTLDEAIFLWVELSLALGERSEAMEELYEIVSIAKRPDLGVLIAHCAVYDGDNLRRDELSWKLLTVLGRELEQTKRADTGARVAYVLRAVELKQYPLAESAIATLQRDFPELELDGVLGAQVAYFKAVESLTKQPYEAEKTLGFLLEARSLAPEQTAPISALQILTQRFPELKAQVKGLLGPVDAALEKDYPKVAAMLYAYLGELDPDRALENLNKAWRLDSARPDYLAKWVTLSLKQSSEAGGEEQEMALLEALAVNFLTQDERYPLLVALGQLFTQQRRWAEVIETFERALTLGGPKQSEVHRNLGLAYQAMGHRVIADEHKALAGK